jgi:hypothetical protein
MSHSFVIGTSVCDGCNRSDRHVTGSLVEIYWASGNKHYCEQCWPGYADYYESESGRRAWTRIGDYYAPIG